MLVASFYINYKRIFELILTGDNTKNTVIQRKSKKYSTFVKTADFSKILERQHDLFLNFLNYVRYLVSVPGFKCLPFFH